MKKDKRSIFKKYSIRISLTTYRSLIRFHREGTKLTQGEIISDAILSFVNVDRLNDFKQRKKEDKKETETKPINTLFNQKAIERAKALAAQFDVKIIRVIELALRDYLAKQQFESENDSPLTEIAPIRIKEWINPFKKKPSRPSTNLLIASPDTIPAGASLFVDAYVLFLGITHRGLNPKKTTSPQCARLIQRAKNGEVLCFTSVYEIARLSEILNSSSREPFPIKRITSLFRFVPVLSVGMEDLILDADIEMTFSARAASSSFLKIGHSKAVATISDEFDELLQRLGMSVANLNVPFAIYKPTDV
jgi:hypothetical protein